MGAMEDKLRKAKDKAKEAKYYYRDSQKIADKVAKTATGQDLTMAEKIRAGKIIQGRRTIDTAKTVARGAGIQKMQEKKAAKKRLTAAVSGGTAKKATPKAKQKTLNDFLKEGKRPPSKNKKIPSDADVIIKGYNDKKTLSKNKKRK
jgi:F0F1-type ATP synthase gamma subunit